MHTGLHGHKRRVVLRGAWELFALAELLEIPEPDEPIPASRAQVPEIGRVTATTQQGRATPAAHHDAGDAVRVSLQLLQECHVFAVPHPYCSVVAAREDQVAVEHNTAYGTAVNP